MHLYMVALLLVDYDCRAGNERYTPDNRGCVQAPGRFG